MRYISNFNPTRTLKLFALSCFAFAILLGTANQAKAQVCLAGTPTSFSPVTGSSNESCPGECDGTVTIVGYLDDDDFPVVDPGQPDYPYTGDWFVNGGFAGTFTVTASIFDGGAVAGVTTITNLCDGDVVTIITCSADGQRSGAPNTVATIGLDALLPNEPLLAPAGESFLCNGVGSIALSASENATGGEAWNATMTYQWTLNGVPIVGASGTGLPPAIYNATATGEYNVIISNACTVTDPANITISDITLTAAASTVTAVSCFGASDGEVTVTPAGWTGYTFSWDDPATQNTALATGLACGINYNVVVTATGTTCTVTDAVSLTCPPAAVTATAVTDVHESCPGASDGQATATGAGGDGGPYTFTWDIPAAGGPGASDTQTGLTGGAGTVTYNVTVTDGAGCIDITMTDVTVSPPLTVTNTFNDPVCATSSDGDIDLTVTGGNGIYTFVWSNGQTTEDISGLDCGVFTVTVNPGACQEVESVTLTCPPAMTITGTPTHPTCATSSDGSVDITVTGGTSNFTYLWDNGAGTAEDPTNLDCPVTYTVIVTDDGNPACTVTDSYSLTCTPALTLTETVTQPNCASSSDGDIDITVTGGLSLYSYNWSNGSTAEDQSNLACTNTFDVTVIDNGVAACSVTGSYNITCTPALTITDVTTHPTCATSSDGDIDITVTGGNSAYTYNWDNGIGAVEDPTNLTCPVTYNVTVEDGHPACTITQAYSLTCSPALTLTEVVTQPTCATSSDGDIDITVTGGTSNYTYSWSNGSSLEDLSSLACTNTFDVTVIDNLQAACSVTGSYNITCTPPMTVTGSITHSTCASSSDGSIDITATGGSGTYTYNWDNGIGATEDPTNLACTNTFNVTVLDNGVAVCSVTEAFNITCTPDITVTSALTHSTCAASSNGAIDLTVTGGVSNYAFTWDNGLAATEDQTNLTCNTYNVTVIDNGATACSVTQAFNITCSPSLTLTETVTQPNCASSSDGDINITVTGGVPNYAFTWSNGAATEDITNLACTNTFDVTVVDDGVVACSVTGSYNITCTPALTITDVTTHPTCATSSDGDIDITVAGGNSAYTYNWDNGIGAVEDPTNLACPVTYNVTVEDGHPACTITQAYSLTCTPPLTLTEAITQPSCATSSDGSIDITVTGGASLYTYNWDNGIGATEDPTNLTCPVTYNVTVIDNGNAACSITGSYNLTCSPPLTVTSVGTDPNCTAASDGSVDITVTGGMSAYTFNWSNGATSEDISNVSCGVFTVTVIDNGNAACSETESVTLTCPTDLTLTEVVTQPNCASSSDGDIDITVTGGTTNYTYNWDNGIGAVEDPTNLACTNTFNVTVIDNGVAACSVTGSYNITCTPPLTITDVTTHPTCASSSDGDIDITVTGGNSAYTYNWDNGIGATEDPTNLACPVTYNVTVTDGNPACTITQAYSLTCTPPLTLTEAITQPSCASSSDGSIDITVTGGASVYTYNWDNGIGATEDPTNLACPVTYNVTVIDNGNAACSITGSYNLTCTPNITVTSTFNDPTCAAASDGDIDITVTGGNSVYTYTWSNGATSEDLSNLTCGTFDVTVVDNGVAACSDVESVTLTCPNALALTVTETDESCNGQSDGTATATAAGGTTNYTYDWSNGETTASITGLAPNVYTVTVIDNGQGVCSITGSVTVDPASTFTVTTVTTPVNPCNGDANGTASITVTAGGVAPYTFNWSAGVPSGASPSSTSSFLSGGLVNVTISDANVTCTQVESISVVEPTALTVTVAVDQDATCNGDTDGQATVTVLGGVPPYNYLWSSGGTGSTDANLGAAVHSVTVTDSNVPAGCSVTDQVTITEPTALTVTTSVTPATCGLVPCDGSASVATMAGGSGAPYTFQWDANTTAQVSQIATGLCGGTYDVTVFDNTGVCSVTATAAVPDFGGDTTRLVAANDLTCYGAADGSITIDTSCVNAPCTFEWFDINLVNLGQTDQLTITGLSAGCYIVSLTNGVPCTDVDTFCVVPPDTIFPNAVVTDIFCDGDNNGSIVLAPTGSTTPYTYAWSTGPTTSSITGIGDGTYTVTVTESSVNTCDTVFNFTLTAPPAALTLSSAITDASCGASNGVVDLTVNGGQAPFTYTWNTGAPTEDLLGVAAGNYTVTVSHGVTVTQPTTLTGSCSATLTAPVNDIGAPTVTVNPVTECYNTCGAALSATITAGTPNVTATWSNGFSSNGASVHTSTATGLCAGVYTVTSTDDNGCSSFDNVTVTPTDSIFANVTVTNITCNGNSDGIITTNPNAAASTDFTYNWSTGGGTNTITGLTAGTYTLTLTHNPDGCDSIFSFTVTEPTALTVTAGQVDPTCFGFTDGSASVTVTGGVTPYVYSWSSGGTTATETAIGNGNVTVTIADNNGSNGCTVTQAFTLTEPSAVTATATIDNNVNCFGGSDAQATVVGSGGTLGTGYSYTWSTAPVQTNPTATGLGATTINVTVTDGTGVCTGTDSVTPTAPATALSATVTGTDPTCNGEATGSVTVTASGGTTGYTYEWGPSLPALGETTQSVTGLNAQTWDVTVTDGTGVCTVTESVTLTDPAAITITTVSTPSNCTLTNGTAGVTVTGGPTTNYSYFWTATGQTTQSATGLGVGFTTINITVSPSCTATDQIFVDPSNGPTVTLNNVTDATCFNGSDGSIDVSTTGGTTPYNFVWNPAPGCGGQTTEDINCLTADTYNLLVTDDDGCQSLESVTVGEATEILVTMTSVDATCGDCDGEMTATVSGGSAPYDFIWSNNGTGTGASDTQTGLCAGIIQTSVTDQAGCSVQVTDGLNNIGGPTGITVTNTPATCFGASDAQACANVTGGTTPYTYLWFPSGGATQCVTGLAVTTHTVEVTDANNCKIIDNTTVTDPPQIVDDVTMFPTSCGQSDGSISVGISGGVQPYTSFVWNFASTSSTATTTSATGLPEGVVNMTVTDISGCSESFSYLMNGSTAPSITLTTSDVLCFGQSTGSITSNVTGGTTAYNYEWFDAGLTSLGIFTPNLSNVAAGSYVLQVTDAVPCIASQIATIDEPDQVQFSNPVGIDPTCFNTSDGTANVIPIGGTVPYSFVWGNVAVQPGGPSATGLDGGVYPITMTDINGCTVTDAITITSPDTIQVDTLMPGTTLCSTGSDGSIDLDVSGGTPPYTFAWNDGPLTTEDRTGLAPGLYIVTVTDANLICQAIDTIVIGGPQIVGVVNDVSCFGGNDGSIDLTVTGFATPFSYQWSPPPGGSSSNVEDPLGLDAMGYIVTVTDSLGCTTIESYMVGESPAISVTFAETSSNCGSDNGELFANTSGGAGGYTYVWSDNSTDQTATGLFAGLYEVSVTDANNCSQTFSTGLSDIGGPTDAGAIITPPSCFGIQDASACVTVTGGTTPYSYAWNPPGTNPSSSCTSGLTTGSLVVEVTDANDCKIVVDTSIVSPSQITDSISVQSTTCGQSDGVISVYPANGAGAPYTFVWSTGSISSTTTSSTATGLAQGAVIVTVTDVSGCSQEFFYNSDGSTAPSISVTSNDVSCYNGSNGDANAFVTGGVTAYTYQWADATLSPIAGQTTASISGLSEGTYFISVVDAAVPSCVATQSIVIDQPDSIQFSVPAGIDPSCFNSSDGSVATIPVGGTVPYTFTWDGAASSETTANVSGLPGGTYHVTLTDNNGCFAIDSVTLVTPDTIFIDTVAANTILCSGGGGGAIDITASGGTSPFTFAWSNGATTEDITGLNSGTYCVTVTDDNGCSQNTCWAIGGPSLDGVTITDALCYNTCDGTIDVTVSGAATPFNYLWNPGGQVTTSATGLCPGTYSLSVTDTNGCSFFVDTFAVSNPDTLDVVFDTTSATCNAVPCNGVITANPFGGTSPYTYQWSDPSQTDATISGVCAGVHPVSISDANGCSDVFLSGLSDVGGPDSVDLVSTNVTCNSGNNGTADVVTVYGGASPYSYSWTPSGQSGQNATNLSAGSQFIAITDNNNCTLVDSVNISEPPAIVDSTIVVPTTCGASNGALDVYVTGGNGAPYSFTWNVVGAVSTTTSSTVTGLGPVVAEVTVSDAAACDEVFTYNVNPSSIATSIDSTDDVSCNGFSDGFASVAIVGGTTPYTYVWDNGSVLSTTSGVAAGTISVTITDGTGCIATETALIDQPDSLIESSLAVSDIACHGNCDGSGSVDYVGGTLPYDFIWSDGTSSSSTSGLCSGTQTVTATDANGCIAVSSISISEPDTFVVDTSSVLASLCAQVNTGEIQASATGGITPYSYLWDDAQTTSTATGLFAGAHCVTATDFNSCVSTICVTVTDSITISIDTIADIAICISEDSLVLVGNGAANPSSVPLSYTWVDAVADTVANDTVASVTNLVAGTEPYTFVTYVTNNSGCFASQTISVTINDLPDVDTGEDIQMILGGDEELGAVPLSTTGTSFTWSPGTFLNDSTMENPTYTPEEDGIFTFNVIVTDDNGCSATDSLVVTVIPEVEIVNIFSPNGDGINDTWVIPFLEQYPEADLKIYNRWGELLYEQIGGYTTPWDGTYNGKDVPIGSYYYVLELNHEDVDEPITGPLAVIR